MMLVLRRRHCGKHTWLKAILTVTVILLKNDRVIDEERKSEGLRDTTSV